jgi:hypothetical protein
MWPSRETASLVSEVANWALIAGLVVGVVATVLIVWMGNVNEAYLKTDLSCANERAAACTPRSSKLRGFL